MVWLMRTCRIDNIDYLIAENFNELSKEQLLFYIENFYIQLARFFQQIKDADEVELVSNKTYEAVRIVQLWNLLRIDKETFDAFSAEDIYFFMEEMELCHFLSEPSNLTKNHFFKLENGWVGPLDDFNDFTAGEYLWTDLFYRNYKAGDNNALNALIATIYRPIVKGKRVPLSHLDIDKREAYIKNLPDSTKIAILLYYEGCMKMQYEAYSDAFSGGSDAGNTYNDLLLQVAKDGPFGNYNQVIETNINLINQELVRLKREAAELEKKLK